MPLRDNTNAPFERLLPVTKAFSPRTIALLPEIAAVLLAVVIGATVWLGFAYQQQTSWVKHTLEVENGLSQIMLAVEDAETGSRGFLLTGDDIYLEGYAIAVAGLPGVVDSVMALAADNTEQHSSLASLLPIIENRLERLQEGIEIRRKEGLDAAVRFIQAGKGYDQMLQVRSGIAQLQRIESDLLRQRSAGARQLILATSISAAAGIFLVILAVAGWIWNQRRDARRLVAETAERQLAEAKIRQMQKLEAIGQLTGGIAHDFNNMLTVIISGLSLIKRRLAAGDTAVLELADATMDGANRAAALTSRLMAFARQQPLEPQHTDANKLVSGMAELINRALGEPIRLETVLAAGLWPVHVDPPQLESALLNLCVNARDAMPEGGKLTIETANAHFDERYAREHDMPVGQYVLIAVSDTGVGMTPDVLAKAFEPFFTTKGEGSGTGLGLSQVHGFIKQSGGHVKIYSEPGHGTSIKIYLPRLAEAGQNQISSLGTEARPTVPDAGRSQLILVVDDDDRVRELTVSMLRELGYAVRHANGASAALHQLHDHPGIALLFTDIVMPETNGRKLADHALAQWPHLKVLFTTGFTRNAIVHGGVLDSGVNFIAKPFTLDQLAAKVGAVLAAGGTG